MCQPHHFHPCAKLEWSFKQTGILSGRVVVVCLLPGSNCISIYKCYWGNFSANRSGRPLLTFASDFWFLMNVYTDTISRSESREFLNPPHGPCIVGPWVRLVKFVSLGCSCFTLQHCLVSFGSITLALRLGLMYILVCVPYIRPRHFLSHNYPLIVFVIPKIFRI